MIKIPDSVHALLSPSKAHLWLTCKGGLAAAKGVPPKPPSRYAAEGTVYHDLARRALVEDKDCDAYVGDEYEVEGFRFKVDADNAAEAQKYVDIIRAIPGRRFIEVDLEYSALLGVPRHTAALNTGRAPQPVAAGTGDAVILDYANKVIHVVDLKFGRGDIVYAKENAQLRLYGAAAVARYDLLGITDDWLCRTYIVQPRVNHYDDDTINVGELKAWTEQQKGPANRAYTLWSSPHLMDPTVDLTPGDKQCRWCPLSGNCVAQRERVLEMFPRTRAAEVTQALATLDDVQLVELLDMADEIERALSAARGEALARALRGVVLPNWKLVQGRRGNRALDETAAITLDVAGLTEIGIEEPDPEGGTMPVEDAIHFALGDAAYKKSLLTAAQLEKKLTKKAPLLWAALQSFISQKDGAPGLERMEDPRPPLVLLTPEFPTTPEAGALPSLV